MGISGLSNIFMKRHTPKQYAQALYKATSALKGEILDVALTAFASILKRERALARVDKIMTEYVAYAKEQAGEATLKVTSSSELSASSKKTLATIFGQDSEIEETIDPSVLGGLKVRRGDTVYDATVRTQLATLRKQLVS